MEKTYESGVENIRPLLWKGPWAALGLLARAPGGVADFWKVGSVFGLCLVLPIVVGTVAYNIGSTMGKEFLDGISR